MVHTILLKLDKPYHLVDTTWANICCMQSCSRSSLIKLHQLQRNEISLIHWNLLGHHKEMWKEKFNLIFFPPSGIGTGRINIFRTLLMISRLLFLFFFQLGFTSCKVEQPLQGMEILNHYMELLNPVTGVTEPILNSHYGAWSYKKEAQKD